MEATVKRRGGWLKRFLLRFRETPPWGAYITPNGSAIDYAKEFGDGTAHSVVMAPVLWAARTFPEAPVALWEERDDGQFEMVPRHDFIRLIRRPNPYFSASAMWAALIVSYLVDGNAYLLKVRDRVGRITSLWPVPWSYMSPEGTSKRFITHYEYKPNGTTIRVPAADVIHFRFGADPNNPRAGLSPLRSVLREVYTDSEAAKFTATLLTNAGVPGLLVAPDKDASPSDDDVKAVKAYIREQFTGDKRGEPLVMSAPTKVEQFGFSPEQLQLRDIRRIPEERVTAVLGIPAIVAGLGAGLDRSTFSNMAEAREMAFESAIIPTQRTFAEELKVQLLDPEFTDADNLYPGFDLRRVRVLHSDRMAEIKRATAAVNGGLITLAEGRRDAGYQADNKHDVFYRPGNVVAVPADDPAMAAPTPVGAAPPADGGGNNDGQGGPNE